MLKKIQTVLARQHHHRKINQSLIKITYNWCCSDRYNKAQTLVKIVSIYIYIQHSLLRNNSLTDTKWKSPGQLNLR